MKKKKLLIVTSSSYISGIETHTYDLIEKLIQEYPQYEVYALAPTSGPWVDKVNKLGIRVIIYDFYKHYFKRLYALYKILKKYDFDIVHNHAFTRIVLASAKLAGVSKRIHSVHIAGLGKELISGASKYYITNKIMDSTVSHYIANSKVTYNELVQNNISPQKISVIYYGLKEKFYSKKESSKNAIFTIGFLGRLEDQKNIDILIKALSLLKFNFKCLIGGSGSLYKNLEEIVHSLKLDDKVYFLGNVESVSFLDKLDLFVLPSKFESLGLVLLEASARKVPIICSAMPVTKELKENFIPKIITFPIGDYKSLAEKIQYIYDNYHNKDKIREIITENFNKTKELTIKNMINQIVNIYETK